MNFTPRTERIPASALTQGNPWRPTLVQLLRAVRQKWRVIVLCGVVGAALGVTAKFFVPVEYRTTAQLLFDPRGLRVFNNDLTSGYFDANSAINFVESQMAVLKSERVFSRAVTALCSEKPSTQGARTPTVLEMKGICYADGNKVVGPKALSVLRTLVTIKRTERSFVVDVTAVGPSPDRAAHVASTVVSAYIEEDAATKAEASGRLTAELTSRLNQLRENLRKSESKSDAFRQSRNLVRVSDKLLVEQRLAAATAAMNESQGKLDRISARVKQIESASRNPSTLGALGAEADTRGLLLLVERRNAVMVELAPLAARAGARHPGLIEVRSRLAEVERSIAAEMNAIRAAARSDMTRARNETATLTKTVADLSGKLTASRMAEAELRTLDQEVDANRKVLEAFEMRSREANEFGKIDSANLRVVSVARAPSYQRLGPRLILWGIVGMLIGMMLSIAGIAGMTILNLRRAAQRDDEAPSAPGQTVNGAYAMQLRAQAFARYRYG